MDEERHIKDDFEGGRSFAFAPAPDIVEVAGKAFAAWFEVVAQIHLQRLVVAD